ncbi:MAG: biopolymer transporter ExbD [Isosphaeraceae bacterium]
MSGFHSKGRAPYVSEPAFAWLLALLLVILCVNPVHADEFERLDGDVLAGLPASPDANLRERLTVGEIAGLPNVLSDVRSSPVIVVTDQGNPARLLLAAALRKPQGGEGNPLPILVLERFETFEAPKATTRLARGRDLLLFDGFQLDLDSGQIVPEGQGGDVQFVVKGDGGPRLVPLGKAKLYTLSKSPLADVKAPKGPSAGRSVLPGDFAGQYRFYGNGQWSGMLTLTIDGREAFGSFRSDQTGTTYKVTGHVAVDAPQKLFFEIQFPRSRLGGTGYLWTEGKGALAGTVSLLDHEFGFFALRNGGRFQPEAGDSEPPLVVDDPSNQVEVVVLADGRLVRDGKPFDVAAQVQNDPTTRVMLRIPADVPYHVVAEALESLRTAGIADVRIIPESKARP